MSTSKKTLATLHGLYFSDKKPEALKPLDIALVTYLVLRQSDDHFVYDSQDTLAQRLGCERKTVADSIKRLETAKWIHVERPTDWNPKTHRKTRTIYAPLGLSVNLDKLPTKDRPKRFEPSIEANALANEHNRILNTQVVNSRYKRSPRRFERHQAFAAQRLIDDLGSFDAACEVVGFALSHPAHRKVAETSLYALRKRLKQIQADLATTAKHALQSVQKQSA